MTDGDAERFGACLTALAQFYRRDVNPWIIETYFNALADLDYETVDGAARDHVEHSQFFPTVSDLRYRARGWDPRQVDAWYKRGWNPETPGFLPTYDGQGAQAPALPHTARGRERIAGPMSAALSKLVAQVGKRITSDEKE